MIEYKGVIQKSMDPGRLEWLFGYRLSHDDVIELVSWLSAWYQVPRPAVRFTLRDPSGRVGVYLPDGAILKFSKLPIAESVAHEFAHHLHAVSNISTVSSRRKDKGERNHTWDFVWRLDDVAMVTQEWMRGGGRNVES